MQASNDDNSTAQSMGFPEALRIKSRVDYRDYDLDGRNYTSLNTNPTKRISQETLDELGKIEFRSQHGPDAMPSSRQGSQKKDLASDDAAVKEESSESRGMLTPLQQRSRRLLGNILHAPEQALNPLKQVLSARSQRNSIASSGVTKQESRRFDLSSFISQLRLEASEPDLNDSCSAKPDQSVTAATDASNSSSWGDEAFVMNGEAVEDTFTPYSPCMPNKSDPSTMWVHSTSGPRPHLELSVGRNVGRKTLTQAQKNLLHLDLSNTNSTKGENTTLLPPIESDDECSPGLDTDSAHRLAATEIGGDQPGAIIRTGIPSRRRRRRRPNSFTNMRTTVASD